MTACPTGNFENQLFELAGYFFAWKYQFEQIVHRFPKFWLIPHFKVLAIFVFGFAHIGIIF